ncbi:MAG: hypothetical protein IK081_09215, partial [Lachnospiraceae bacterium]|nr:hypothetical protein [Lachnospiraceae bacterium]
PRRAKGLPPRHQRHTPFGNGTDGTKFASRLHGVENFEKNSELKLLKHFSKFSIQPTGLLSAAG